MLQGLGVIHLLRGDVLEDLQLGLGAHVVHPVFIDVDFTDHHGINVLCQFNNILVCLLSEHIQAFELLDQLAIFPELQLPDVSLVVGRARLHGVVVVVGALLEFVQAQR